MPATALERLQNATGASAATPLTAPVLPAYPKSMTDRFPELAELRRMENEMLQKWTERANVVLLGLNQRAAE